MTSRRIEAESLVRFAKKVSFPAILAIPLIGGALAASWSSAETAQAGVEPSVRIAPQAPVATPAVVSPVEASPVEAPATPKITASAASAPSQSPGVLQQAALTPGDESAGAGEAALESQFAEQAVEEIEPEPATVVREITVVPGDTLMSLLVDAGAERVQAHQAATAMEPVQKGT